MEQLKGSGNFTGPFQFLLLACMFCVLLVNWVILSKSSHVPGGPFYKLPLLALVFSILLLEGGEEVAGATFQRSHKHTSKTLVVIFKTYENILVVSSQKPSHIPLTKGERNFPPSVSVGQSSRHT